MKSFSYTIDIHAPRNRVVALFKDPDNLKHWQDGFLGITHLSGTPGEAGARSLMRYDIGKRELELTETITSNALPDSFAARYEAKSMVNTMVSRFEVVDDQTTRYTAEVEYTELRGIMIKLMAFLMPGMFKKQVAKWIDQFKAHAEQIA